MPRSRIDTKRFVDLYREHGSALTWAQYAELLSTDENKISAGAMSGWVSLNRERLKNEEGIVIERRVVKADKEFPWPNIDPKYWNTFLYRYLQSSARVRVRGEAALDDIHGTLARWRSMRQTCLAGKLVVRYDPGRGFYTDRAKRGETPGGPESMRYFYRRHPQS